MVKEGAKVEAKVKTEDEESMEVKIPAGFPRIIMTNFKEKVEVKR